jgi:hypothetical protein
MKHLAMSGRRFEKAKAELIFRGLVTEANVKLGNYRPVLYIIPTEKAIQQNDVANITLLKKIGNVGIAHAIYQDIVAEAYALSGYAVFTEHTVNGRRYDVYAVGNERTIGIEIELTTENFADKIQNSEVDELVAVFRDREQLDRLRATVSPLEPSLLRKVRFTLIADYLRMIRNKIDSERAGTNSNSQSEQNPSPARNKDRNKGEE